MSLKTGNLLTFVFNIMDFVHYRQIWWQFIDENCFFCEIGSYLNREAFHGLQKRKVLLLD